MSRHSTPPASLRAQLAREAARLMAENGIADFALAKRKAAERLRVDARGGMPTNSEVEEALMAYQRLFRAEEQGDELVRLRRTALQVMRVLHDFSPRLIGPVLTGTADEHSGIQILVRVDPPESLSWFLTERRLPHRNAERRLRFVRDHIERIPAVEVMVDGIGVELLVLSGRHRTSTPLSPVDGRPMKRASVKELEVMLEPHG